MSGTKHKPIMKLTLDNKLVDYYNTMELGALSCGKKDGMKMIRKCCRGEKDSVYGFKWRYVDESILTCPLSDSFSH